MKFVISTIIFLLLTGVTYGQELRVIPTCVNIQPDSAAKMVVELESCRIISEELNVVTQQVGELTGQMTTCTEMNTLYQQKEDLYKQIIALQQLQIVAAEKGMKDLEEHNKYIQTSYQQLLKDAKPNPVWEFFKSVLGMGAGYALGYGLAR